MMGLSLWSLLEAALLCVNAVCILDEARFLSKIGWSRNSEVQGFGDQPSSKAQIVNLIYSIRTVMKIPLIFINIVTIVFKLLLG